MTTRRDFLRTAALATAAVAVPRARAGEAPPAGAPDFTAAFLTDIHVDEQRAAAKGLKRAVFHALAQPERPELLITGGDLVMDILAENKARADQLYDLYDAAFEGVDVPVHPCLGNHDCLGIDVESGLTPAHELYGKAYFRQRFGVETYRSFDHRGWHFVLLDSVQFDGRDYVARVDAAQLAWLEEDLARAAKPTVVAMHIPLLTNFWEWQHGTAEPDPAKAAVVNCHEVLAVLERHPVKLVLAGHLHINESYRYMGMELANVGAVSGGWWGGPWEGCEEGYALLDFRGEEVRWRYVDYGWHTRDP
jgi:3',5'-cyclic-AMP phosphodiesterase